MRLPAFVFIIFGMLAPLAASVSIVLPFLFPDKAYFAGFAAAGLVFALLSRVPALAGKTRKTVPRDSGGGVSKFGILSAAVIFWALISAVRGEYMPLAFAAFYFALVLAVRHEEEWVRLSRFILWIGALSAWIAVVGRAAVPFLEAHLSLFAPAFFLAIIFWVRPKSGRLERWGYALAALWLAAVLAATSILGFSAVRELVFWKALWVVSKTRPLAIASFAALWLAVFAGLVMMRARKTATWLWVAGLAAAFAGLFWADPLLSAWVGSGTMFFFLAALVEWVSHNDSSA